MIDQWQKQDKWASKDIYFEDYLITRALKCVLEKGNNPEFADKEFRILPGQEEKTKLSKGKNEVCCQVCQSGGIF